MPTEQVETGPADRAAHGRLRWTRFGEPEGKGWSHSDTLRLTDRLPARAEHLVPTAVWDLSRHASGLYHRFRTDAAEIAVRWTLPQGEIAMPHMSAVSVSGVDLYAVDDDGQLRFAAVGQPTRPGEQECILLERIVARPGGLREYRLYLPTYNRADDIAVGVNSGARLELLPPDPEPPVVYYGTSIVQGAAASRPGMGLPAVLGRRLRRTVVNLGMSGNAKMESALADLIAEVDAALFVIDCLSNMTAAEVADRTEPFVRRLRERHRTVPILLIEDRTRANAWVRDGVLAGHAAKRAALRAAYRRLVDEGDRQLHYLDHHGLFGCDGDGTVDGSHPTDLGAERMLRRLDPIVRSLLDGVESRTPPACPPGFPH